MPVVNVKAAAITAGDTAGQLAKKSLQEALLKESVGTIETTATDSIGSTYRLCRVPSNARVTRVLVSCDAITTAVGDVGLYRTAADGGAVVEVDTFGSAVALTAALVHSDITHESDPTGGGATNYGVEDAEKPLWQVVGLTVDPGVYYDVVVTLTAAATGIGTLTLKTQYADGN